MLVPFENVGAYGILQDPAPHKLPPGAWSAGCNVRFRDGKAEKFDGHSQIFGAPAIAPYHLLQVVSGTTPWWVYAGLTKVYVYNNSTHNNITRQTAAVDVDYTATASKNWTSCVLGGIPILNNGNDPPQKWTPVSTAQRLLPLDYVTGTSTWESLSYTAGAMRSYLGFLIALDVDKNGTRYPQMVKWSHPAVTGTVPASWDETDTSKDAGEYDIAQSQGACLDCLTLKDTNIIYKEDSVWGMQFVGGLKIHRFWPIFREFGLLSRRCVVELDGVHYAFGAGDVIRHDGQRAQSLVATKIKEALFSRLSVEQFATSFVVYSRRTQEIWFCFPETGATLPNLALVYNLNNDTCGFRDLPSAAHIVAGAVNLGGNTWATATGTWAAATRVWGEGAGIGSLPRLLFAVPGVPELDVAGTSNSFNGTAPTSYLERMGVPITFHQKAPPDFTSRKVIREVWPQLTGTLGGVVNVKLGAQERLDGPISWTAAKPFRIGQDQKLDFLVNTRVLSIRFESDTAIAWEMQGFTLNATRHGMY